MAKFLWGAGVCVVIMAGVFIYYASRPIAAPSVSVEELAATAEEATSSSASAPYRVLSTDSAAEFSIEEVLRGKPFTAHGTASVIEGDSSAIRVNARTFTTESENRDKMIARFILESEKAEYEFIEFRPAGLAALLDANVEAMPVPIEIKGDLVIRGVAKPATFRGTIERKGDNTHRIIGEATVSRIDFGLTIPSVPSVASVSDAVKLTADIVFSQ